MTSIEDKIMGNRSQNYISSSEDEDGDSDSSNTDMEKGIGGGRVSAEADSGTFHVPIGGPRVNLQYILILR